MLKKFVYVALSDVESYNTWIEFKKINNNLIVSIIENEQKNQYGYIVTEPFTRCTYSDWNNVTITLNEFKSELIRKTQSYLNEVGVINPAFIKSKRIQKLIDLLSIV